MRLNTLNNVWSEPSSVLPLAHINVHLWRASLKRGAAEVAMLRRTLSPDEVERAERYYFQKDRESFIVARGLLRKILCFYLPGMKPEDLRFHYNSHGKPALTERHGGNSLNFNLSHSHALVLYAITRHRRIGIDLEFIRDDINHELIAQRYFAPDEVSALQALERPNRKEAFFHCWTSKEAYVKAQGLGLSLPLDQFAVSVAPDGARGLLRTTDDQGEAAKWSLKGITPINSYIATLAVEGHEWQLSCWQYPE